jgi:hypothetical protein
MPPRVEEIMKIEASTQGRHSSRLASINATRPADEPVRRRSLVIRASAVARATAIIGHGDHLAYGIIKSLFVKMMMWLLDRRDPQMRGIRYLHYGAIQHGNAGLAHWKDRFRSAPFAFRLERTRAGPRLPLIVLGDAPRAHTALAALP